MASPPAWVRAVDAATSVEDGLRAMYEADPAAFFLYAEQVRRGLELKFGVVLPPKPEAAPSSRAAQILRNTRRAQAAQR